MKERNTYEVNKTSVPYIFLASSALAYFTMPEVADPMTRLVASGVVGMGTSAAGSISAWAGGIAGTFTGHALLRRSESAPVVGLLTGAIIGAGAGIYGGHTITKDFMINALIDQNTETVAFVQPENEEDNTTGKSGPIAYNSKTGQTFQLG